MRTSSKILLSTWVSSVTTFALMALYMLRREAQIDVPGELSENFASSAFLILIALMMFSVLFTLWSRKKEVP